MAVLSRVADDYHFGVRNVVMGAELAFQGRTYLDYWDTCFGSEGEEKRPKLLFIPEVMAAESDFLTAPPDAISGRSFQKISKSISRGYFLSSLDVEPVALLFHLASRQMTPTLWSGRLEDVARTILDLRLWVSKARWDMGSWVMEPDPVTKEDLEAWNSA